MFNFFKRKGSKGKGQASEVESEEIVAKETPTTPSRWGPEPGQEEIDLYPVHVGGQVSPYRSPDRSPDPSVQQIERVTEDQREEERRQGQRMLEGYMRSPVRQRDSLSPAYPLSPLHYDYDQRTVVVPQRNQQKELKQIEEDMEYIQMEMSISEQSSQYGRTSDDRSSTSLQLDANDPVAHSIVLTQRPDETDQHFFLRRVAASQEPIFHHAFHDRETERLRGKYVTLMTNIRYAIHQEGRSLRLDQDLRSEVARAAHYAGRIAGRYNDLQERWRIINESKGQDEQMRMTLSGQTPPRYH